MKKLDDGMEDDDATLLETEEKEEKLKVVVRIRPLQKNEDPWWEKVVNSNERTPTTLTPTSTSSSSSSSTTSSSTTSSGNSTPPNHPSTLTVRDNSLVWEKNGQIKMLTADAVFDHLSKQEEIFHTVEDCVDGLFAGYDCSVFAYGQTGTGKTYTMSGIDGRSEDGAMASSNNSFKIRPESGIVPRAIEKLFNEMDHEMIYNEKIYDILSSDDPLIQSYTSTNCNNNTNGTNHANHAKKQKSDMGIKTNPQILHRSGWNRAKPVKEAPSLSMRQKLDGTVFVDGLTLRNISSKEEMVQAFHEGSLNREVRDNIYNQHSSRGHSVFQITLRKTIPVRNDSNNNSSKNNNTSSNNHRQKPSPPPSRSPTKPNGPSNLSSSSPRKGEIVQEKEKEKNDLERDMQNADPSQFKTRLSRLFLVDLAGSEKWHVNGSELSEKYANEISSINKSLSALTNCVQALSQKERTHIPFRDSILTRLLQSCLQGVGRTAFLITVSPARTSLEESFATLRFAERLKRLNCRPIRKKAYTNELLGEQRQYYELQIHAMRLEVNRLRELLRKAQRRNQEITDNAAAAANTALIEENRRLKELLAHTEPKRTIERPTVPSNSKKSLSNVSTPDKMTQKQQEQTTKQQTPPSEPSMPKAQQKSPQRPSPSHESSTPQKYNSVVVPVIRIAREELENAVEHEETTQEIEDLVTKLHTKEAKLNWMLEAEMEAHNTKDTELHPKRRVVQDSGKSVPASTSNTVQWKSQEAPEVSTQRSTITRGWAVERKLKKNLVNVPGPVRSAQPKAAAEASPSHQLPALQNPNSPRGHSLSSTQPQSPKEDTIRRPVRPAVTNAKQERNETHITAAAGSPPPRPPRPNASLSPSKQKSAPPFEEAKSSSILKLMGTESAEKLGKSKDQLVEEYKRARRAELEAMVRS